MTKIEQERSSLYNNFLQIQSIYSKLNDDDLKQGLISEILMTKDAVNSRDKRKIKSILKKFIKVKSSIDVAINSLLRNLELIETLDKLLRILESFENIYVDDEDVNDLLDTVRILYNSVDMYRFLVEKKALRSIYQLRFLNDNIKEINRYYKMDKGLSSKDFVFIHNVMEHLYSIPNTMPDYDIYFRVYSANSDIEKAYKQKVPLNDLDLRNLFLSLQDVEQGLLDIQDENFLKKANDDVLSVKRVVHPQVISVSKENLKMLKESDKVIEDIEILKEEIGGIHLYDERSKALMILDSKIEKLKEKMENILLKERKLNDDLSEEQFDLDKALEEAIAVINRYDEEIKDYKTGERKI